MTVSVTCESSVARATCGSRLRLSRKLPRLLTLTCCVLLCVLPYGFSGKRETTRSLHTPWLLHPIFLGVKALGTSLAICGEELQTSTSMASVIVPRGRGLLLFLSVTVIVLLILRAFTNISFGEGSVFGSRRSTEIKMLTYNIWFSDEKMRERMEALGEIVEDLEPDLLTFQEVTRDNLAVLREQRWFSRYHLVPWPPDLAKEGKSHFVVILSSFPVERWEVYTLKTSPRNRTLVVAEPKSFTSSAEVVFVIATTHLAYSGYNTKLREEQLRESVKIISAYDNVCVMGDLNIQDKVDGDVVLPSPWIDAWLSISGNSESNGYTWDRNKTPFASVLKSTVNSISYQIRLDRVLCKLSDFKVKEMRIVGDKVTKSGVRPSDHFGLFTVIELVQKTEHKHDNSKKLQTDSEVYFNRPAGWEKLIKQ